MSGPAPLAVFCDFDGTISTCDIGRVLLEQFADESWRHISADFHAGRIDSREALVGEFECFRRPLDEVAMRAAARAVPLDPGFGPLVAAMATAAVEFTVVSDGWGFYVEEVCAPLGVHVLTNSIDFVDARLDFPHTDACCPCTSCGVCKQAPIRDARRRGLMTVLIGDGASDRKAAMIADVVFAKEELALWCEEAGVAYRRFETLVEVDRALARMMPNGGGLIGGTRENGR